MTKTIVIKNRIKPYNKKITVDGDKSLSIRWALIASQCTGKSKAYNLLMSEDVIAALDSIKKLGIKVRNIKIILRLMEMELMALSLKKTW